MYLIATSFHVNSEHYDAVVDRIRNSLAKTASASGLYTDVKLAEIMVRVDEQTRSFTLQLETERFDEAIDWLQIEGAKVLGELSKEYGDKVVCFTTPMEII